MSEGIVHDDPSVRACCRAVRAPPTAASLHSLAATAQSTVSERHNDGKEEGRWRRTANARRAGKANSGEGVEGGDGQTGDAHTPAAMIAGNTVTAVHKPFSAESVVQRAVRVAAVQTLWERLRSDSGQSPLCRAVQYAGRVASSSNCGWRDAACVASLWCTRSSVGAVCVHRPLLVRGGCGSLVCAAGICCSAQLSRSRASHMRLSAVSLSRPSSLKSTEPCLHRLLGAFLRALIT